MFFSYPTTTSCPFCRPRPSTLNTTSFSVRGSGLVKMIFAAISLPTMASPKGCKYKKKKKVRFTAFWIKMNEWYYRTSHSPWCWGRVYAAWRWSALLTPAASHWLFQTELASVLPGPPAGSGTAGMATPSQWFSLCGKTKMNTDNSAKSLFFVLFPLLSASIWLYPFLDLKWVKCVTTFFQWLSADCVS